jgi:hypothetical protein
MIKIEVKSTEVVLKSGVGRSGRPYEIREQYATCSLGDEIRRVRLTLDRGQSPYPVGVYTLAPESIGVDQWGGLQLRPVLRAHVAPAKAG